MGSRKGSYRRSTRSLWSAGGRLGSRTERIMTIRGFWRIWSRFGSNGGWSGKSGSLLPLWALSQIWSVILSCCALWYHRNYNCSHLMKPQKKLKRLMSTCTFIEQNWDTSLLGWSQTNYLLHMLPQMTWYVFQTTAHMVNFELKNRMRVMKE